MVTSLNQNGAGSKRVVVVGCGRLGATITTALAEQGYSIHILDLNFAAFERLPPGMISDGQIVPIVGDGTLESDLRKAYSQEADVFIAVTGRDTRNALAAQTAKHIFQVPNVICRMNDPIRTEMYNELGIVAISATKLVSDMILTEATSR
ncbi:MAG: TrkA family potassium uptake protein [Chloroflexi bacterium]|nr:TrkA family potassium uptake protein [Chloroflexota bacterium]